MFLGDPAHQGQEPEPPIQEVSENDSELSAGDENVEEITSNTETENVESSEAPENAETPNQISDQVFEDLVSELSEETASEESDV